MVPPISFQGGVEALLVVSEISNRFRGWGGNTSFACRFDLVGLTV